MWRLNKHKRFSLQLEKIQSLDSSPSIHLSFFRVRPFLDGHTRGCFPKDFIRGITANYVYSLHQLPCIQRAGWLFICLRVLTEIRKAIPHGLQTVFLRSLQRLPRTAASPPQLTSPGALQEAQHEDHACWVCQSDLWEEL